MNRRSFLTFLGFGALGAIAAKLEPPQPFLGAQDAVVTAGDMQWSYPADWDESANVVEVIVDPGHTHTFNAPSEVRIGNSIQPWTVVYK